MISLSKNQVSPNASLDQIGFIEITPAYIDKICFSHINGESTLRMTLPSATRAGKAFLKPGRNVVSITHAWTGAVGGGSTTGLWLNAEPGGKYEVKAKGANSGLQLWIEDKRTGKTVGGLEESTRSKMF